MTRTLHLMIEGRVQGVGYRQWFSRHAQALGLTGWVRNRTDGRVEAMVSGPRAKVEELLEASRRGPRLAVVSKIVSEDAAAGTMSGFLVLPNA